jgi:hypothetical protein
MSATVWVFKLEALRDHTDNFQYDVSGSELSKQDIDRLTMMPEVSQGFLDASPKMMQMYDPKFHAQFRKAMAYLTTVRYQQQRAWQIELERSQAELEYITGIIGDFRSGLTDQARKKVLKYLKNKGL